ncbi:hypothetical protein NLG97_g10694 [Lecanicillium saksenae]|uniref:Uncharacterized protein n=1 Tax=Lecanicillium saksenae TaxID=468837 RepID=A0ACC1QCM6_9HYPO|nr:hypothetical protein NLG97_g10694 [Lecanicillium saksenae]
MAVAEIIVSPSAPMPKGYKLLRKGYPFMTALCRRKTLAAGRTLYVVRAGSKTLGLRAPRRIVDEVYEEERQTRATRRAAVAARDVSTRGTFAAALRRQFPGMPGEDADKVLRRTLKKRSGRVGRTGKLGVEDKVRLAVAAHARHAHTDYDVLVRGEKSRAEARKAVYGKVREVLAKWEGGGGEEEEEAARPRPTEEASVRRGPGTRPSSRTASRQSFVSLGDDDETLENAASSLDDPILISSDSEGEEVDMLIISSDEE